MPSAFEDMCKAKNVDPEARKRELATPILPSKCLLDMTDQELEDHYASVEQRAEASQQERALIVLARTMEGRLERRAVKVFNQHEENGAIEASQVKEMLQALRYDVSDTELHYLLRKFDATDDFEMIPETVFMKSHWLSLVGECQMLKETYQQLNPEAFEICYETMIENLKRQKAVQDPEAWWPQVKPTGPGWWATQGAMPGYEGPLQPYVWGMQPEVEAKLESELAATGAGGGGGGGASATS